ncbi:YaiI/YqxD family protein [Anaerotalea alkaliphila]|uniref:UPF0178 protein GXN74_07220 n=1 Tax=Anaerotalea alkaliphila TaxID=2662126 RepID=A0A7X5KN88_9FIRM|nr:DUF188 domain-containing protein [Anaerotalea alkaliphila]NDL67533.1 YaiI/YqxD family protein [Anaerotalea alkaliphila]
MHRIYVDADGCPVVKVAIELAKEFQMPITVVKNYAHLIRDDYAEVVTVDLSQDSADFYIVNHLAKGDVVVTQDYGLAAMCLGRGAIPINQNGLVMDDSKIDGMLLGRHVNRELRRRGIYQSKVKKRDRGKDQDFAKALRKLLQEVARDGEDTFRDRSL